MSLVEDAINEDEVVVHAESNNGFPVVTVKAPLPPSDNKLYANVHGHRVKTAVCVAYTNTVLNKILKELLKTGVTFDGNASANLVLDVFFKNLENKGWGKKKGGAKTRFKKQDIGNREKLITDILAKAVGIDDSSVLTVLKSKHDGNGKAWIVASLSAMRTWRGEPDDAFVLSTRREEARGEESLEDRNTSS